MPVASSARSNTPIVWAAARQCLSSSLNVIDVLDPTDAAQVWVISTGHVARSPPKPAYFDTVVTDNLPKDEAAGPRALIGRHIEKAVSEARGQRWSQDGPMPRARRPILSEALKTLTFPSTMMRRRSCRPEIVSALNSALELAAAMSGRTSMCS